MPFLKSAEDNLPEIAHAPASASVSSSSSFATPLLSLPSQSSCPMNNAPMSIAGINVVVVTGLRHRRAVVAMIKRRRILSAQAEEGVVQAASGVGAVASVALLLLCHLCCHRRRC